MTCKASVPADTVDRDESRSERHRALRLLRRRPQHVKDSAGDVVTVTTPAGTFPKRVTKVSVCMHHSIAADALVKVRVTPTPEGPRAGFAGLMTCGSVWVCPVCSNKIATERALEIAVAVARWEKRGGRVAMLTLTMAHNRHQSLAELWDAVSAAWNKVTSGRQWMQDQDAYGILQDRIKRGPEPISERRHTVRRLPWIRAVEVTYGDNGWHVHLHVLLFLSPVKIKKARAGGMTREVDSWPRLDALSASMFGRWSDSLAASGMDRPIATLGGQGIGRDIRWIQRGGGDALGNYFTKFQYDAATVAGMEVARGMQKKGRKAGRTPFELLASVVAHLDDADDSAAQKRAVRDLGRWYEWERGSKGRRQVTWSMGLRNLLRLGDEKSDEEIAADDKSTDETVTAAEHDPASWSVVVRDLAGALEAAERWYVDEYLPTLDVIPEWALQWSGSFFDDRVRVSSPPPAPRAPAPSASTQVDDWSRCMGCGEQLDAMLVDYGRHIGC